MIHDIPRPAASSLRLGAAAEFLLTDARQFTDARQLLLKLVDALQVDGVVVDRVNLTLAAMHPQVAALSVTFRRHLDGRVELEVEPRPWALRTSALFLGSPIARFFDYTHHNIRRRLCDPACPLDFDVVADLRDQGFTDYVAMQLAVLHSPRASCITLATRQPGGFDDEQLLTLASLQDILAIVVEAHVTERVATSLLATYLGEDAGARVLAGQVQRGQGDGIRAVISFCDLRNFTGLSDRLPRDALLSLLDDTFDAVVGAVSAHNGEVLKFIGDAVLSIFRASPGEEHAACAAAAAAAHDVLARVADKNHDRGSDERPTIDVGLSLHLGEVHYGNIGGPARLDFTVVGPAVNLASRLQGLCASLGHRVIVSEAFAAVVPDSTEPLGKHHLKGIADDVPVFALSPR
jgi:adenylate cyclase